MAERLSALATLAASAVAGAGGSLAELRPAAILQVQSWPDSLARVADGLAAVTGVQAPGLGRIAVTDDMAIAAIAPGRYLLASDAQDLRERIEAAFVAEDAAVTDLAHGRAILRLRGPAAAAVLQACVAVDLDASVFPPGRAAQTMIHHIDVTILRHAADHFDIWTLRSFALPLAEWVLDRGAASGIVYAGPARA